MLYIHWALLPVIGAIGVLIGVIIVSLCVVASRP